MWGLNISPQNPIASPWVNCHSETVIAQVEIRQLPLPEKLALLEAVWAELASDPDTVEVPQWHKDILDERQNLLEQGSSQVFDWELAKKQINQRVR
jgi:putative addiction module component (TIGR02574 family)